MASRQHLIDVECPSGDGSSCHRCRQLPARAKAEPMRDLACSTLELKLDRSPGPCVTVDSRFAEAYFLKSSSWRTAPPLPCGLRPLEAASLVALRAARVSTPNRSGVGSRLERSRSSASTLGHPTSVTEHERALTNRELALRAAAADRATTELTGIPNDRRTSRGLLLRSGRPAVQRDP